MWAVVITGRQSSLYYIENIVLIAQLCEHVILIPAGTERLNYMDKYIKSNNLDILGQDELPGKINDLNPK